jgi:hypothetical protein
MRGGETVVRKLYLILGILGIALPWALVILMAYEPTNIWLRAALGPQIVGFFETIALSIAQSSIWLTLTAWPWSFVFGGVIFTMITLIAAWLYVKGWLALQRWGVHTAYETSGFGQRTVKTKPKSDIAATSNPIQTKTNPEPKKTPEPEPTVEAEE